MNMRHETWTNNTTLHQKVGHGDTTTWHWNV